MIALLILAAVVGASLFVTGCGARGARNSRRKDRGRQ